MFSVIMLWVASIDGHLSSLIACNCTDLYLFNLFVHLANKLSLSLRCGLLEERGTAFEFEWPNRQLSYRKESVHLTSLYRGLIV